MAKFRQFWIIAVETFKATKYGPYFDEKEADDEAKRIRT